MKLNPSSLLSSLDGLKVLLVPLDVGLKSLNSSLKAVFS